VLFFIADRAGWHIGGASGRLNWFIPVIVWRAVSSRKDRSGGGILIRAKDARCIRTLTFILSLAGRGDRKLATDMIFLLVRAKRSVSF
jgi:hypothetical protein